MKKNFSSSARPRFQYKLAALAVATCFAQLPSLVYAGPTGATVVQGSASFNQNGNTLNITNTPGTSINWQQFNINANETVRFNQQSASSSVLNRVVGADPSRIFGTLQSNGQVFLINQNGILIGPGAMIDVNKFVASTLNLTDADFLAKRFNFVGGPANPLASVLNQGKITTPLGGSVWLIGKQVANEGIITTPQGQVLLAAGQTVQAIDSAGPEVSVTLTANGNKAVNLGQIQAQGGKIDIYGAIVEQNGVLKADSASQDSQGRIHLQASEEALVDGVLSATHSAGSGGTINVLGKNVTLAANASLDVSGQNGGGTLRVGGDYQGNNPAYQNAQNTTVAAGSTLKADALDKGDGGKVYVWSDGTTWYQGAVSAQGGKNGGNGGFVETSGHRHLGLGGTVNTLASQGKVGTWLLDPAMMCIDTGSCSGLFNPISRGGSTADILSPAALDTMLVSSSVNISLTDYFAFLPNGGTYRVGATSSIPAGRGLTVTAPYIYANGSLDAKANQGKLTYIRFNATGLSSSFYDKSGVAEFDSGAQMLMSSTNGAQIGVSANSVIVLKSGSRIEQNGPRDNNSVYLSSPRISHNGGATIYSDGSVDIYTNIQPAAPLAVTSGDATLYPQSYQIMPGDWSKGSGRNEGRVLLGTTSCLAGEWCIDDVTKYIAFTPLADGVNGRWSTLKVGFYNPNDPLSVYVVGNFNAGLNRFQVYTSGTFFIEHALTTSGKSLEFHSDQGAINLRAAVTNTNPFGKLNLIAPTINHSSGGSLEAWDVRLHMNAYNISSPINIRAHELIGGSYSLANMYVGIPRGASNCPSGAACIADTDVAQMFTGSWQWATIDATNSFNRTSSTGGNLYLVNSFNPAGSLGFGFQGRNVHINAPVNTDRLFWMSGSEGVYINQPIAAKAIDANIERSGYYGSSTPPSSGTIRIGANGRLTATASSVTVTDEDGTFTEPGIGLKLGDARYTSLSFVNEAGSSAISAPTWAIGYRSNGSLQLNGLSGALTTGSDLSGRGYSGDFVSLPYVHYYGPAAAPAEDKVDSCKLNPAQCVTPVPNNTSAGAANNTNMASTVTVTNTTTTTTSQSATVSGSDTVNSKTMDKATIAAILEQRQQQKSAILSAGLKQLDANPALADLPVCSSMTGDLCVPVGAKKARGGATAVAKRAPSQAALPEIERKVAVLFAVNDYADPRIPALEAAVYDAEAIANTLTADFGYEVRVVRNPSKAEIVRTLKDLGQQLDANDSLLVYYAGHGEMNKKHNLGYWVPADGAASEGKSWVSNRDISRLLNVVDAKQVMLISDSCYSGSFTGEHQKVSEQVLKQPKEILSKRAVTVMSSGGDAPVLDEGKDGHSIFAWNLLQSLKQAGDYEVGSALYSGLRDAVKVEAEKLDANDPFSQVPQYGAVVSARHQQGTDYLFERRKYGDTK